MSKQPNKKDSKVTESTQNTEVEVLEEEQSSPWYVFCSTGCGFCKKAEPIIEELNKEGYDILKLDLAEPDNQALANELKKEYNIQCGTPWFINEATGKGICGFREKDVVKKWLDGEDIPAPPRPKGPMPRPPFHGVTGKEEAAWKKEYKKWSEENSHLPNLQTVDQILERPRPKSEPPRPPLAPDTTDKQYEDWGKEWDEWTKDNQHLPNLQPSSQMIENFKRRTQQSQQQNIANNAPRGNNLPGGDNTNLQSLSKINNIEAKVQALEVKVDKIIKHFGI